MLTYGDGVADIDIPELLAFHRAHGGMVTMTTYSAGQRFGVISRAEDGHVTSFDEKPKDGGDLINIGFMVCEPEFLNYIEGDETVLEKDPLQNASADGQLMAYEHKGFWRCMDTVREKQQLEKLWAAGQAPWKIWE